MKQNTSIEGLKKSKDPAVKALLQQHNQLNETLDAYRSAFEELTLKSKHERKATAVLTHDTSIAKLTNAQVRQQYGVVRELVTSLTETLRDKDVALSHLRKANRILGDRVQYLESRFATVLATPKSAPRPPKSHPPKTNMMLHVNESTIY